MQLSLRLDFPTDNLLVFIKFYYLFHTKLSNETSAFPWSFSSRSTGEVYVDCSTGNSTRKPSWRKGYARQQCVYEGPYGKNLSSARNPSLKPNITSIGKSVAKLRPFFMYPRWPSAAILNFIEPHIAPFDPPTPKILA